MKKKHLMQIGLLLIMIFSFKVSNAQKWMAPASANKVKNPIKSTAKVLADSKAIYIRTCAPCHGKTGQGDGPAAVALNPKPADHSSKSVQSESDGSLYWKLTNGRGAMQAYAKQLTDQQRWGLIDFIRTLKK